MKLRLANPWDTRDPITRIFNELSRGLTLVSDDYETSVESLAINLSEDDDNYYADVMLPGVKPDDVEITVDDRYVTIKGRSKLEDEKKKRKYHYREIFETEFMRTFTLPGPISIDETKAKSDNGILKITLPKSQKSSSKKIKVE